MSTKAPNPVDKYVGSRVRMRRIMLGMSQEKLGEALGLTFQQVQKYEKGSNRITAVRLSEIANALETNIVTLLEGSDKNNVTLSTPASQFIASKVGVELVHAMLKIKEPSVQQAIVALAESLASK